MRSDSLGQNLAGLSTSHSLELLHSKLCQQISSHYSDLTESRQAQPSQISLVLVKVGGRLGLTGQVVGVLEVHSTNQSWKYLNFPSPAAQFFPRHEVAFQCIVGSYCY